MKYIHRLEETEGGSVRKRINWSTIIGVLIATAAIVGSFAELYIHVAHALGLQGHVADADHEIPWKNLAGLTVLLVVGFTLISGQGDRLSDTMIDVVQKRLGGNGGRDA